jgi:hypothetical protein
MASYEDEDRPAARELSLRDRVSLLEKRSAELAERLAEADVMLRRLVREVGIDE